MPTESALAAAVQRFESHFHGVSDEVGYPIGDEGALDYSRAPTGERYLILTSGGLKSEGVSLPAMWHRDEAAAVDAWLAHAMALATSPQAVLMWRMRPELRCERNRYAVYSRLAVRP